MPRILHGSPLPVATTETVVNVLLPQLAMADPQLAAELQPAIAAAIANLGKFGFMFDDLQGDPSNLLPAPPDATDTPAKLITLGEAMADPGDGADPVDSDIPAVYTYLGQFIDHDITFESGTPDAGPMVNDPNLAPLDLAAIEANVKNGRSATLDLDCLYNPDPTVVPMNGDMMDIGDVTVISNSSPNCDPSQGFCRPARSIGDNKNDLPRKPPNPGDDETDREALIGDPRNDENLIISQLHVAFLRAHNEIVKSGQDFAGAQKTLRQHYQHIVLHDFLPRIADKAIVDDILTNGSTFFNPDDDTFFMPLEFSFAAFRFGHTMIRDQYRFNINFSPASLKELFTFTALSGGPGGGGIAPDFPTLPDNWIIEWENIIDLGPGSMPQMTRRLDTKLADPGLFKLQHIDGTVLPGHVAVLGIRNLLRGYLLRIPTGQAVATELGFTPMTGAQIEAAAASDAQVTALQNGGFSERTPLWYYIQAEAAHHQDGKKLGPVGSTIVAAVLIGLARRSTDSILDNPEWTGPTLTGATPGTFTLTDLLKLANVLA